MGGRVRESHFYDLECGGGGGRVRESHSQTVFEKGAGLVRGKNSITTTRTIAIDKNLQALM